MHFPRDYYNGWCIKWLIEKQISGETGYKFQTELPFIDWATSFWADGKNARSDGLSYDCNTDYGSDGLHLSELGERKAGEVLFNYFKQDTVSKYWFYEQKMTGSVQQIPNKMQINIYPNPANSNLSVILEAPCKLQFINSQGQLLFVSNYFQKNHFLDVSSWAKGMYFVQIISEDNQIQTIKISII